MNAGNDGPAVAFVLDVGVGAFPRPLPRPLPPLEPSGLEPDALPPSWFSFCPLGAICCPSLVVIRLLVRRFSDALYSACLVGVVVKDRVGE